MLKEIQLAGSRSTPFGSFCGAFADVSAVELGKAAVERSGEAGGRQKNFPWGTSWSGAIRPNVARQIGIGRGFGGGGTGIAMALN